MKVLRLETNLNRIISLKHNQNDEKAQVEWVERLNPVLYVLNSP